MRGKGIPRFEVRVKVLAACPPPQFRQTAVRITVRDHRPVPACPRKTAEEISGFIVRQVLERDTRFFDG